MLIKPWKVSSCSHMGWIREGEFRTKKEAEKFVKSLGGKTVGIVNYEIWKQQKEDRKETKYA